MCIPSASPRVLLQHASLTPQPHSGLDTALASAGRRALHYEVQMKDLEVGRRPFSLVTERLVLTDLASIFSCLTW